MCRRHWGFLWIVYLLLLAAPPVSSAAEPTPSVYGNSTLTATSDGLRIGVGEGSGGVRYTVELESGTTHRVELVGETLAGRMTLRVHDALGMTWDPAPNGLLVFGTAAAGPAEILIYSDKPAEYVVRSLRVLRCDDCPDDSDLLGEIRADLPGIDQLARSDPAAAAGHLLRWASPRIPFATAGGLAGPTRRSSPADVYYGVFQPLRGGVACGGASVFLQRILELFDLEAFTVDFGQADLGLTHVAVVLAIRDGSGYEFHYLDPTFNLKLESDAGQDLLSALDAVRPGTATAVRADTASLAFRPIFDPELPGRCDDPDPGWSVCDLDDFLRLNAGALERGGYRQDAGALLQLLSANVFGYGPDPESEAVAAFARELTRLRAQYYSLAIDDVTVSEGFVAEFTVSLSPGSDREVLVPWSTRADSAAAGLDFEPAHGTLTFAPGETAKKISIPVYGNSRRDAERAFFVILGEPVNAKLRRAVGTAWLIDDDGGSEAPPEAVPAPWGSEPPATPAPRTSAFRVVRPPSVVGRPAVGRRLVCKAGRFTKNPQAISFSWLRRNPLRPAIGRYYWPRRADAGGLVACKTSARLGRRTLTSISPPVRVPRPNSRAKR